MNTPESVIPMVYTMKQRIGTLTVVKITQTPRRSVLNKKPRVYETPAIAISGFLWAYPINKMVKLRLHKDDMDTSTWHLFGNV